MTIYELDLECSCNERMPIYFFMNFGGVLLRQPGLKPQVFACREAPAVAATECLSPVPGESLKETMAGTSPPPSGRASSLSESAGPVSLGGEALEFESLDFSFGTVNSWVLNFLPGQQVA